MLSQRPIHQHDCDVCEYLGSLNGVDMYYCPYSGGELIRRGGSRDDAYTSWPATAPDGFVPNRYALLVELARSMDLL